MASKDPRVRQAACMVRALRACSPAPRYLPSQSVLRLAAWELGPELPDVLRRCDVRRLRAAGLTRDYAAALLSAFPDVEATRRLECGAMLMLDGLAPSAVPVALELWGLDAPDRLGRDPYGAMHELKATLEDADAYAKPSFDQRVAGHARWALLSAAREGHTMLPTLTVLARLKSRLDGASMDDIRRALAAAVAADKLALVGPPDADEGIAEPEVLRAEAALAADIRGRASARWLDAVDLSAHGLTAEQQAAAACVFSASLSVLTGGPGTGKTTVVRALVQALGEDRCLLTAPTGRAARNVGGNTVHRASGGRLLRRRPLQETSKADVPSDLLLMVVDEASMLSTELMVSVLSLAPPRCHVVLVGDADQLPPVGRGSVLCDLLRTRAVPVGQLGHNHRCGDGIQRLAAAVLAGKVPDEALDGGAGVVLVEAATRGAAMAAAVGEVVRHGAQVLTPQNAARSLLNRALQSALLPGGVRVVSCAAMFGVAAQAHGRLRTEAGGEAALEFDRRTVRLPVDQALTITRYPGSGKEVLVPGDSVMVIKNQNKKRVQPGEVSACNGDIGVLRGGAGGKLLVAFEGGTAEFARAEGWLTLAYAATVHKFQGSECDSVALPLAQCAATWDRELLYTAITRARTRVALLGTRQDVRSIASRARPARHSILRRLLL